MSQAKIDHRPEGSVLLCAKMYGAWNEAVYLANAAQADGCQAEVVMLQTRAFSFNLQTIECSR